MKISWLLTVGFLFIPLFVQGEKLPADGQEEVITAYRMKEMYDEGRVLGGYLDIDGTNAVLGGDCDIDCTTAEHGTDY